MDIMSVVGGLIFNVICRRILQVIPNHYSIRHTAAMRYPESKPQRPL